ncbi:conserved hypothetical protein [Candidatus Koribacter versatilis Ellin345]|uniref:DUF4440 domain-containing protein n=1 Tax=Koribacter versatilis (strain Ellin345) TaxID=204669 RepID=Q1IV73_KORVE|nr:SgcJ/EcaC family oxidoreductase [Candidatus Koribacter versatilis]ABF39227.1 conserved hypothetical protein [Candidatus Koribacter versatilis Ellin345]
MGYAVVVDIEKGHSLAAAVEAIARKHEQAWNSHDRRAYEEMFTEEADFVNVIAQHARGRDHIGRDFEQIHRTFMRNSVLKTERPEVRPLTDDSAIAHIRWEMTGMEKLPGWNIPDVRRGVLLYVLVKRDGEWKVTAFQNTEEIAVKVPE